MIEMNASPVIDSPRRPGSPVTVPTERLTYLQIADDLEARIRVGEYPPGSQFASYSKVAELYSVGISTAQAAMRMLRDRGFTVSVSGVGTFVVDQLPDA